MTEPILFDSDSLSFAEKVKSFTDLVIRPFFTADLDELLTPETHADRRHARLVAELKHDTGLQKLFLLAAQKLRREKAEPLGLEQSIRAYGLFQTQIFIIAYRLAKNFETEESPLFHRDTETHLLALQPFHVLKYASLCRKHFGEENRLRDHYFNLGLLFDLVRIAAHLIPGPDLRKRREAFIDRRFVLAVRTAGLTQEIVRTHPSMKGQALLVTLPLLIEAGRCAMATLFPDYAEWTSRCDKLELSESVRGLAEQRRFQGSFRLPALTLCWSQPELHTLAQGVLYSHTPWVLDEVAPDLTLPVSCYSFCWHLMHQPKLAHDSALNGKAGPQGPVVRSEEFRPELSGLNIEISWSKAIQLITQSVVVQLESEGETQN